MTELPPQRALSPHVPPELVKDLTIGRGFVTERLPHEIVDEIHRDFPPVFYAPNLMNGGGWVFRRSEDQLAIWQDPEHFSSQQIQPFAELAGGNWTMIPVEQDPPEHGFYRRLLMPFFCQRQQLISTTRSWNTLLTDHEISTQGKMRIHERVLINTSQPDFPRIDGNAC